MLNDAKGNALNPGDEVWIRAKVLKPITGGSLAGKACNFELTGAVNESSGTPTPIHFVAATTTLYKAAPGTPEPATVGAG
jgi:hypothetical protein